MQATAYPYEKALRFTLTLNIPQCIWRLDYDLGAESHRNPMDRLSMLDNQAVLWGPGFHAWKDNRYLPHKVSYDKLSQFCLILSGF
jgi:hypothetical protein